jgi:hypothetical protein
MTKWRWFFSTIFAFSALATLNSVREYIIL